MYQLYRRNPQAAREFTMERLVGEVACLLDNVARSHQVRITTESTSAVTLVVLPEGEVKQILYNLIRNAIQASPRKETVVIRMERDGAEFRVAVVDSGEGISEDLLPHIFDPFFTTKGCESKSELGMGLGLSVSRSLIEAMGGSISVDTSPGEGSCFTAAFPTRFESHADDVQE
jgi:signal transduction histidine kinase